MEINNYVRFNKSKLNFICQTLVIAFGLCGCGLTVSQKTAINAFAASTTELGKLAADEFKVDRDDVISINQMTKRLGGSPSSVDGGLTIAQVQVRTQAVLALRRYGDLLQLLTASNQTEQLKLASDAFVSSLSKIKGIDLTSSEYGAIGEAVEQIGGLLIEYERKQAIADVIKNTHRSILIVVNLILQDFDRNQEFWSLAYDKSIQDLRQQINLANQILIPNSDLASNSLIKEAESLVDEKENKFSNLSDKIIESCERLKTAESALLNVINYENYSIDDINLYIKTVQDFVDVAKILSK